MLTSKEPNAHIQLNQVVRWPRTVPAPVLVHDPVHVTCTCTMCTHLCRYSTSTDPCFPAQHILAAEAPSCSETEAQNKSSLRQDERAHLEFTRKSSWNWITSLLTQTTELASLIYQKTLIRSKNCCHTPCFRCILKFVFILIKTPRNLRFLLKVKSWDKNLTFKSIGLKCGKVAAYMDYVTLLANCTLALCMLRL